VAAYCASILGAADHRVGAFTSPHLRDYRERIRIAERYVETDELLWAFETIEAARGDIELTFFEYNTLAALLILGARDLDAWVLEIGMGGRLDAVNVVDPDVAVIVSIGFDHQEFLGASLEAIAREKAGIFRPLRPAVLGSRTLPEVISRSAEAIGAPLKRLGLEFDFTRTGATWNYRGPHWTLHNLPAPALFGDTQYDNAATAIAAIEEIRSRLPVGAPAVARGLAMARLVGRFQVIAARTPDQPAWVLDVAHNQDAARVLARNLRALPVRGRTLAVCGILADKDAVAIAAELRDGVDAWWFASTDGPRGSSAAALRARVAPPLSAPAEECDSIGAACAAASAAASGADRILVFGSFHTVGPALDWLEARGVLPAAPLNEYTAAPIGHRT
jgi:dihydrofolate synthase/folylpolyglutamate synthase